MYLFGRTLLGGALLAGYITVSGVATCGAAATGEAQVLYKGAGTGESRAHISGDALRSAVARGVIAQSGAEVSASPLAHFLGSGAAEAYSLGEGSAQASFYGQGSAQAFADTRANLYRRVRMPFQTPAKAIAEAQGEVVSYVLAYGRQALARASLVGTSYHVGKGKAQAFALLEGDAQKLIGSDQFAHASASVTGTGLFTLGAAGIGLATAQAYGDATVTRAGVRYFELVCTAVGTAEAELSHVVIYQPQMMRGYAIAYGEATQIRGFAGKAQASAKATGYMDMTYTGQVGAPAEVTATASANAVRLVTAGGVAQGNASGLGALLAQYNGAGVASLKAEVVASTLHFLLADQPAAQVTAEGIADAVRSLIAEGVEAQAVATATGFNQINDLTKASPSRTVTVAYTARLSSIGAEPRTIRI